jgi:hypothetical protein
VKNIYNILKISKMANIIIKESQLLRLHEQLVNEVDLLDGDDSTKMANGSSKISTSVPIHDTSGKLDMKKSKDVSTDEISHTLSGYRMSDVRRY